MDIRSINLNLFKTSTMYFAEKKQNASAQNNISSNPFAGKISNDIFQSSSLENTHPNVFARKAADLVTSWNKGIENIKLASKELFAPAISFAGQIKAGYQKLNSITLEDMYNGLKNEISMLTLDSGVRKYMKMPVADIKDELQKELTI